MAQPHQLAIPPRGTRGRRAMDVLLKVLAPLTRGMVSRYRRNAKEEPPTMNGLPLVVLTTVGAKTGQERSSLLGGLDAGGGAWVVIASKAGSRNHPGWLVNLCKNPDKVWLEAGKSKLHVRPELLSGDDYEGAYPRSSRRPRSTPATARSRTGRSRSSA